MAISTQPLIPSIFLSPPLHLYPDILSSPSRRGIACSTLRISVIFWWPRKERGVHTQKPNTKYRTRDRPFIRRAGNLRSLSRVNHFYVSIISGPNVSFYLKKKKKKKLFSSTSASLLWSRFNLHNNLKSGACNGTCNRSEKSLYVFTYQANIECKVIKFNNNSVLLYIYIIFLIHKYNGLYRFDEADEKEIYI